MPQPASTVIGYVVDVQANVLTASLVEDDQGRAPTVTIGDEDILVGQIGSYVAIRQNDVNLVAIVTRMTEQEALAAPTIETPGEKRIGSVLYFIGSSYKLKNSPPPYP